MRRKIVIPTALLIAVLAIGGGLAVTHKGPLPKRFRMMARSPAGARRYYAAQSAAQ